MHSTVFATNDLDMCWIIFLYNDNKGSAGSRERVWEDVLTLDGGGGRLVSIKYAPFIHNQRVSASVCVCICVSVYVCMCVLTFV